MVHIASIRKQEVYQVRVAFLDSVVDGRLLEVVRGVSEG
jgi:hypothetical protein